MNKQKIAKELVIAAKELMSAKEDYKVTLEVDASDRAASVMESGEVERIIKRALDKTFSEFHIRIRNVKVR